MSRWLPRSVFGQLALIISLVLLGAGVTSVLLVQTLVTQPRAGQLLRAMDGFATVVETLSQHQSRPELEQTLHAAGLRWSDSTPGKPTSEVGPLLRAVQKHAPEVLDDGCALQINSVNRQATLWLRLNISPPLWIGLDYGRRTGTRGFSALWLLLCALLVWVAAAYFARRLVLPLRALAAAAPAIVQGNAPPTAHARDPREIGELARALGQASDDVRGAAAERALMLAGISHDLRTPLTRLQFALEMLPDTDQALRADITRDVAEIDAILSQFIAYARDGRDEPDETLDLAEICRHVVGGSARAWQSVLPPSARMRGKPLALQRAIENLVGNAERHGAEPFSFDLRDEDGTWVIDIVDAGPGLSAEAAERARKPFIHDQARGGSGLGLSIVDRVAHQHGGELRLLPNSPTGLHAELRLRSR